MDLMQKSGVMSSRVLRDVEKVKLDIQSASLPLVMEINQLSSALWFYHHLETPGVGFLSAACRTDRHLLS